jgi:hypothetical protein
MDELATVLPIVLWVVSSAALLGVVVVMLRSGGVVSSRSTEIEVAHARRRSLTVIRYRREIGGPSSVPEPIPGQVVGSPRPAIERRIS